MSRLACSLALLVALALPACIDPEPAPTGDEELAATAELPLATTSKADASWDVAPTHHVGERAFGHASQGGRRVFPVWLAGAPGAPVPLDVVATAADGATVRVAVLGPLVNGQRTVLAAGGYATPRANVELSAQVAASGEHLIVVGSHELASETFFDLATHCDRCDPRATDVLAEPRVGALVATDTGMVQARLGAVLDGRAYDVELELWASPPMRSWAATKVATGVASGTQVNVIVPSSVRAGDDLRLVVREAGGRVIDTGVLTRFAPVAEPLVRTDAILYGDLVSLEIAGVTGFFEGHATLALRSEARHLEIARYEAIASRPGDVGIGFGAFDATFAPPLETSAGTLNPDLPHNGDLLSVGTFNGNGDYERLGCFEYCNDLSGMETCTGGPRSCPTGSWP